MKIHNRINNIAYSFVMLAPVVAVASSILITTFNKNVKEEFSYKETIHPEMLLANKIYHWSNIETVALYDLTWTLSSLDNIDTTINVTEYGADWKGIIFNSNYMTLYNGTAGLYGDFKGSFDFSLASNQSIPEALQSFITYDEVITKPTELKDTFYNSLDQVKESKFFAWSNESFVYNPIATFGEIFNLPRDSVFNTFMSYWVNMTLIYLSVEVLTFMVNFARHLVNKFEERSF